MARIWASRMRALISFKRIGKPAGMGSCDLLIPPSSARCRVQSILSCAPRVLILLEVVSYRSVIALSSSIVLVQKAFASLPEKARGIPCELPDEAAVYFAHSYYAVLEDATIIATETDYPTPFTSMIWQDNVFATQFHPEKSQRFGLSILHS